MTGDFVGDRDRVDPRSDKLNTEFGLFIYGTVLAEEVLRLMEYVKVEGSYRLRLSADGRGIEWVMQDGDKERVFSEEPEADNWKRLLLDLLTPFVPEDLL